MNALAGTLVAIDGVIVTPERATVSVFDRGFLYGDAVFEVFRTYRGVPFGLGEHLARLRRSAALMHIPVPIDERALASEIALALEAARAPDPSRDVYARLMLTRGTGPMGLDPDLAGAPLRVLVVAPVAPPIRDAYARGVGAALVATTRAIDGTSAVGAKVTSYLAAILAVREANARGAAEALIVDLHGNVVEGATSNVMIVKGGALSTPPESAGILAGVTRAYVLEAALARGIATSLVPLVPDDLFAADEVFVTSSIREVLPVVTVDGRTIAAGAPGPITRQLHCDLRARAGVPDLPMPWD